MIYIFYGLLFVIKKILLIVYYIVYYIIYFIILAPFCALYILGIEHSKPSNYIYFEGKLCSGEAYWFLVGVNLKHGVRPSLRNSIMFLGIISFVMQISLILIFM